MQEGCKVKRCIPCKGHKDRVDGLVPFRGRHTGGNYCSVYFIYIKHAYFETFMKYILELLGNSLL
jgi:hypothetical protein